MNNHTTKKPAEQLSGILAKMLTTEEWCAGILFLCPMTIRIMESVISDADFTDSTCKAMFQSVREIIGDDDRDPIDFVDRLSKAMGKRGVDAFALQDFCDRLANKIPRAVDDRDADIWSVYLADESRSRRERKRIEESEKRIVEVRQRFDRGGATVADIAEVLAVEAVVLRADGGESAKDGDEFACFKLTEIPEIEKLEWLVPGIIYKREISQWVGDPKIGKSTMVRHLMRAAGGSRLFLGHHLQPFRTLIISEEGLSLWKKYNEELGIGDGVEVCSRPKIQKTDPKGFDRLVRWICGRVKADDFSLIVIDSQSAFIPSDNENDNSKMEIALSPLRRISEAGAAILCLHHSTKTGGEYGKASRGGSAICGFFDSTITMTRVLGVMNQRRLHTITRFDPVDDMIIELVDGEYRAIGSAYQAMRLSEVSTITKIITGADRPGGLTWKEIQDLWPDDRDSPSAPKRSKLCKLLKDNSTGDLPIWIRSGGEKNNPLRYDIHRPKYQPESRASTRLKRVTVDGRFNQNRCPSTHTSICGWTANQDILTKNGVEASTEQNGRLAHPEPIETTTNGMTTNGYSGGDPCPF